MNDLSAPEDLVREQTCPAINRRIDDDLAMRVQLHRSADHATLSRRIAELEREWDIERVLETNASTLIVAGTLLGVAGCRRWLLVPAVVSGFLLHHALRGWCPPIPLLRRLGVRTRKEIERERYALKVLRGDFHDFVQDESRDAGKLIHAVST